MGFFSSLLGAVASAVSTVINVVADAATTIVTAITGEFNHQQEKYADVDIDERKRVRFEQLKDVNNEIIELEKKKRVDGTLPFREEEHLEILVSNRNELRKRIEAAKEFNVAKDIVNHSGDYGIDTVDPKNPNELTRLGGQVMIGKKCTICDRPMAIRWPTKVQNPGISDLFWGCTGFFVKDQNNQSTCRNSEPFSEGDMRLFGHIGRPGMELPAENLNKIVTRSETAIHIQSKLKNAVDEQTEDYLCPVHHEKMELKTKKNASEILDLYYLRCSRCDQIVKIKSATQLDAVMESYNGNGLFSA